MKSYAESITLTCLLGHDYRARAWRIIHAGENPELLAALEDGSIAKPACPVCGRNDKTIADSLLLFLPQASKRLVFSPMRQLDPSALQQELNSYVATFRDDMADEWKEEWDGDSILVVPRPSLPGYLKTLQGTGETLNQIAARGWNSHEAYRASWDPATLNEAVAAWEEGMRHSDFPDAPPETKVLMYMMAAEDLRYCYVTQSREVDFERAMELMQAANALPANRLSTNVLGSMGLLQLEHHSKRGDFSSLTQAVIRLEAGVIAQKEPDESRTTILLSAARAWRFIFNQLNIPLAIDRSIELLRIAATEAPPDSIFAAEARNRLGDALDKRHQRFTRLDDLNEAEGLFTWVIENRRDESQLATAHNGRGCVLLERYVRSGQLPDLDRAVPDLQKALNTDSENAHEAATCWIDLGNGLRARYEAYGDFQDLLAAIRAQLRSVEISRLNSLSPQVALHNLSILMGLRHKSTGQVSDLDEAIDIGEACLAGMLPGSQHQAGVRLTLGPLLCERYNLIGDKRDLLRAVEVLETVQELNILASHLKPTLSTTLGEAQLLMYRHTRDIKHLDDAVRFLLAACESADAGNAVLPSSGFLYAAALSARYKVSGNVADLDQAVEYSRRSIQLLPPDSSTRLQGITVLAHCLEERFRAAGDETDRRDAAQLYREAASAGEPHTVLESASYWVQLELENGNWAAAAEASDRILSARTVLLAGQALRSHKEAWLEETQGASANAAYAFARTGSIEKAVAALEDGAAILLSEALGKAGDADGQLRAAAHNEITEVRRGAEEIQNIAARFGGPIVYLATTSQGGLALAVTSEKIGVVWLAITNRWLVDLLFQQTGDHKFGGYGPAVLGVDVALEPMLENVLQALEEPLLQPLRQEIANSGCNRIALVLSGQLALLPIASSLLQDVCVTVQANARALAASMDQLHSRGEKSTALVVGNPLPAIIPLPAAEMEALLVARHFSSARLMTGAAVVREEVIDALREASHVHFACHGLSAPVDPLSSALYLGEQKLTVRELLLGDVAPKNARLVALSACQSAIPDFSRLPDEMVGLPLVFLQAGVPGIVATLWPVSDLSTALLMNRFYSEYLDQGMAPSEGLRTAQLWLRSVTAAEVAEYFRAERNKPDAQQFAPYATISEGWRRFAALEPNSTPFRSPVYWAAFVYYGI